MVGITDHRSRGRLRVGFIMFATLVFETVLGSNIMVPLERDNYGLGAVVSLQVSGFTTGNRMAALTLSPSSFITTGREDAPANPVFTLGETGAQFAESSVRFVRYSLGRSRLAIGHGSSLYRAHGPISIMRTNSTNLVLNSTESFFVQNCAPNSLVNLPYIETPHGSQIEAQVIVGEWFAEYMQPRRMLLEYIDNSSILRITPGLHVELHNTLLRAGLTTVSDSDLVYTSCMNKSRGPIILVSFPDVNNDTATIALYPEDYLRDLPGTNRCRLMIEVSHGNEAVLNLLHLPGINIRLPQRTSRNETLTIQICDSYL